VGQNVELLNVKLAVHIVTTGGTYSDHWALKGEAFSNLDRYESPKELVNLADKYITTQQLFIGLLQVTMPAAGTEETTNC
jgi:hypothetical protein